MPTNWVVVMGAYLHWVIRIKRYPGRAHGKQGRLKKDKPIPLVDLYEQEAKNTRTATEGPRLDGDESSSDEGGDESSQEDEEAGEESAEGAPTAGDFEVQAGWHVLSEHASSEEEWTRIKKNTTGRRSGWRTSGTRLLLAGISETTGSG